MHTVPDLVSVAEDGQTYRRFVQLPNGYGQMDTENFTSRSISRWALHTSDMFSNFSLEFQSTDLKDVTATRRAPDCLIGL